MRFENTLLVAVRLFAGCCAVLLAAQAQAADKFPCKMGDKTCALKAALHHTVKNPSYWKSAFAKPVEHRIGVGSPELVEFLILDTIHQGIPNKPRASTVPPDFQADVAKAFAELPPRVKALVAPKLAGIYFVDDIGGTGFTDLIGLPGGKASTGFIVLDPTQLTRHTANAWATWKENTPFKPAPGYRLEAEIETRAEDTRKQAIQYILLHEIGHVLSIGANIHPSWNVPAEAVPASASYPFFEQSWVRSPDGRKFVTRFDAAFPERLLVTYYFGAKLEAKQMAAVYGRIEATNFPTLYAATHFGDDFAEAFASYVHTVVMNRPWSIRIYQDGRLAKTYASCWDQPRCAEKRKLLERLLEGK
jgi:hypothetical protein